MTLAVGTIGKAPGWPLGDSYKDTPQGRQLQAVVPPKERTAVDLAVPFLPRISTPPILGLMALSMRARFMAVWPTMAVNGKWGWGLVVFQ